MAEAEFRTESARAGEIVVVASGEIDIATSPDFDRELDGALASQPVVLVINLAAVEFMDSSGLNSILRAARATGEGTRLVLDSPSDACRRVLEATGLDELLDVRE
jgi:anti-anti-sigma factor